MLTITARDWRYSDDLGAWRSEVRVERERGESRTVWTEPLRCKMDEIPQDGAMPEYLDAKLTQGILLALAHVLALRAPA